MVHNQPYDESLEVSDGEEIASTNATPRGMDQPGCPAIYCTVIHVQVQDHVAGSESPTTVLRHTCVACVDSLSERQQGKPQNIQMCKFPNHSLEAYMMV